MENYFTCALVCFLFVYFSSASLTETEVRELSTVSTKNVTAHYCPFPCTVGNVTFCYPPPCPPPACVDPAKYQPTDCCEYCPNGKCIFYFVSFMTQTTLLIQRMSSDVTKIHAHIQTRRHLFLYGNYCSNVVSGVAMT